MNAPNCTAFPGDGSHEWHKRGSLRAGKINLIVKAGKKAELQSPVKSNSIVNAKNAGVIKFNGSDITSGYDFTNGGDLIVVTYEVTGTGSAKTSYLWESASTIENNKIITHIDDNGKSDGTVTLSTSYK